MKLDLRILVVDDTVLVRKLIAGTLKQMGITEIFEATDGKVAWQLIQHALPPFDVIISDWKMPEGDGIELLKNVRTSSRLRSTPFIMVTAERDRADAAFAMAAGIDALVLKPFTPAELQNKLVALISRRRAG